MYLKTLGRCLLGLMTCDCYLEHGDSLTTGDKQQSKYPPFLTTCACTPGSFQSRSPFPLAQHFLLYFFFLISLTANPSHSPNCCFFFSSFLSIFFSFSYETLLMLMQFCIFSTLYTTSSLHQLPRAIFYVNLLFSSFSCCVVPSTLS